METQETVLITKQGTNWIQRLLFPLANKVLFHSPEESLINKKIFNVIVSILLGLILSTVITLLLTLLPEVEGYAWYIFAGTFFLLFILFVFSMGVDDEKRLVVIGYNEAVPLALFGVKTGAWLFMGKYYMWLWFSADESEKVNLEKQELKITISEKLSADGEPMFMDATYVYMKDPTRLPIWAKTNQADFERTAEPTISNELLKVIGKGNYNTDELTGDTSWIATSIIGKRGPKGELSKETDGTGKLINQPNEQIKALEAFGVLSIALVINEFESVNVKNGTSTKAMLKQIGEILMQLVVKNPTLSGKALHEAYQLALSSNKYSDEQLQQLSERAETQWNRLNGKTTEQRIFTAGGDNQVLKFLNLDKKQ